MNEQQTHQMILDKTHHSGAEEWYCPLCARRFLLSWPPEYKKIILNAGDELAIHNGGKGGLGMGSLQITQTEESPLPENIRVALEKILKKSDLEDSSTTSDSDL